METIEKKAVERRKKEKKEKDKIAELYILGIKAYFLLKAAEEKAKEDIDSKIHHFYKPERKLSTELRRPKGNIETNLHEQLDIIPDKPRIILDDMPQEEVDIQKINSCICNRQPKIIFCHYCGFHTRGRKAKLCPKHKNVFFVMDLSQCPKCKGYELTEVNS